MTKIKSRKLISIYWKPIICQALGQVAYISYAIYEFIEALKNNAKTIMNNYCLLCISIEDSRKS